MKEEKKITIITNLVLVAMLLIIGVVCFYPQTAVTTTAVNENVYYNGNKNSNYVSLMFNIYQNTPVVYKIMDVLDEYEVKATFFIGGAWADDNSEALKEIVKRGHELGNHGYFHKDHDKLTYEQNIEEITLCHNLVKLICGYEIKLFAPPSGAYSEDTVNACLALGLKTIMWSKDTIDWRDKSESLTFSKSTEKVVGGDLILMHPEESTANALPKILKFYKENNLKQVTVLQNIST